MIFGGDFLKWCEIFKVLRGGTGGSGVTSVNDQLPDLAGNVSLTTDNIPQGNNQIYATNDDGVTDNLAALPTIADLQSQIDAIETSDVNSVNGVSPDVTGNVSLTTDNIPQGSLNFYATEDGGVTDNLIALPTIVDLQDQINNIDSNVDYQDVYNNSVTGETAIVAGKPVGYASIEAGIYAPAMTSAQFQAITSPKNGLYGWASDLDRFIVNTGTPGSPNYEIFAYESDVNAVTNNSVYGEMYFHGNTTETIIAVVSTPVKVNATYSNGGLQEFNFAAGALTYNSTTSRTLRISVAMTATLDLTTASLTFFVYKNGAPIPNVKFTGNFDGVTPSLKAVDLDGSISLSLGDTVEVFVQNNTDTSNVVVGDLNAFITSIGGVNEGAEATLEEAYTAGDGTMTMTAGKPLEFNSTSNAIIPTVNTRQVQIPAPGQTISSCSAWGTNNLPTNIKYYEVEVVATSPTNAAERTTVNYWAYSTGLRKKFMTYNGQADWFNIHAETSFFSGIVNVGPSNAGVNYTLGCSVNPTTTYISAWQSMWISFNGTNVVVANSFPIGNTIEMEITGIVSSSFPVSPNVDSGSEIRITFGSVFSASCNPLYIINPTNYTHAWKLSLKITRINTLNVIASACGVYFDNTYTSRAISFNIAPPANSYNEAVNTPLTIEYANNNSPGNSFNFIARNLVIKQCS